MSLGGHPNCRETEEDERRDLDLIVNMGANAIRMAHYPQSQNLHELCDRLGILVWDEIPLVSASSDSKGFKDNAEDQLREMILQLGNYACVAWWGIYNEIDSEFERNARLASRLNSIAKQLDPLRITVGASFEKVESPNPIHRIVDANCWNNYPGWYRGNPGLDKIINEKHEEIGRRIGISEYGAGGNPEHHQEDESVKIQDTKQIFHPEEFQSFLHERAWESLKRNNKVWGSFIWNMFDFTAANRCEGGYMGLNDKGLVTYDRTTLKDSYYLYQCNWTHDPLVHLTSKRFSLRNVSEIRVKAYTTLPELSLEVNGISLGTSIADQLGRVYWDRVHLEVGKNVVTAVGAHHGAAIKDSTIWMYVPDGNRK